MRKGRVYIGTSGWHYKHWRGTFYPPDTKDAAQFKEYLKSFDTVEINNSFYKLPPPLTFANWRKAVPPGFIFAVKANRFLTHAKKLIVDKESIRRFFTSAGRLREKLGPILFQLPPRWKVNAGRLEKFISALPKRHRYAFEFREPTWYNDEINEILKNKNCAFCIYELGHHVSPMQVTADFVYIRLHGPGNKYQGSYTDEQLTGWMKQIKKWQRGGRDVYIYFDNDDSGFAAFNALTLRKMMKQPVTA